MRYFCIAKSVGVRQQLMKLGLAEVLWNFSPVLELEEGIPIWSRFFETLGEDVDLTKTLGEKNRLKVTKGIFQLVRIM